MRKVLLFSTIFLVLVSCKKSVVIDGVAFTKVTGRGDYFCLVKTSRTVDDSDLLKKCVPLLKLEKYFNISFENEQGELYAELNETYDGFSYNKYEERSTSSNSNSYNSSIIYNGNKCAIISEAFVKSKLNFPLESKINTSAHVHEVEGNQAIIINKFTSKNTFGVTSEYVYKIWMNFNGGEWEDVQNWSYSKLIIENTNTGKKSIF